MADKLRVIIAGSRKFDNYKLLERKVKFFTSKKEPTFILGGAKGADSLGLAYAIEHKYPYEMFLPDWNKYGKRAGYLRNVEMGKHADALIAFWDGYSKGTKHMIDIAKDLGLAIRIVRY